MHGCCPTFDTVQPHLQEKQSSVIFMLLKGCFPPPSFFLTLFTATLCISLQDLNSKIHCIYCIFKMHVIYVILNVFSNHLFCLNPISACLHSSAYVVEMDRTKSLLYIFYFHLLDLYLSHNIEEILQFHGNFKPQVYFGIMHTLKYAYSVRDVNLIFGIVHVQQNFSVCTQGGNFCGLLSHI